VLGYWAAPLSARHKCGHVAPMCAIHIAPCRGPCSTRLLAGDTVETIRFNTGRKYTANGQRITATLHDDGMVTFFDHDRGIDGEFELIGDFTQRRVMEAYDHNLSKPTRRSWSDGMLKGGCNSEP